MLKKLNHVLNIIVGSFVGILLGHGIYVFWDYKTHPALYAMESAPWYTSILLYGLFTLMVFVMAMIAKFIIRKKG